MTAPWPKVSFGEIMCPNSRPYTLGADEDADLVGMRLYGEGPFHRELKPALRIAKKSHFVIKTGDVIYNKLFAWKGTFGIVPQQLDGMFVSDKFPTYELDRSRVAEGYLRWHFRRPQLWEEARGMSTGSAALSKLTLNPPKFLLLTIPLPPLAEQQRIVARIEELAALIDEARALRQRAAEETEQLVAARLWHLFESGSSCGWARAKLGDYIVDACYGTSEKTTDDSTGVPVLRMGNIQAGQLSTRDMRYLHLSERERARLLLQRGDVLVNRTNSAELVGKCAVFDLAGEFSFASYLIRLRLDRQLAEPHLVAAFINSPLGRSFMLSEKRQMTGQANVNATKLRAMPVALPPLREQRRIVAELDALQADVAAAKRLQADTAAELDALVPSILDRAFRGRL